MQDDMVHVYVNLVTSIPIRTFLGNDKAEGMHEDHVTIQLGTGLIHRIQSSILLECETEGEV